MSTSHALYTRQFGEDDEAFLSALVDGHRGAAAAFFDRHADHVERVLVRVLGVDDEIPDLVQEVFVRALRGIGEFRSGPDRLRAWVTRIAVYTARGTIRRRRARSWLRPFAPEALPELEAGTASPELGHALGRAHAVLQRLPADDRIAFCLRVLDGMELREVADACDTSLATIKRRIARARARFDRLARRDPILRDWMEGQPS